MLTACERGALVARLEDHVGKWREYRSHLKRIGRWPAHVDHLQRMCDERQSGMTDSFREAREYRDCIDCGERDSMRLQNKPGTITSSVPLLYACERCRASLTIPPAFSTGDARRI